MEVVRKCRYVWYLVQNMCGWARRNNGDKDFQRLFIVERILIAIFVIDSGL